MNKQKVLEAIENKDLRTIVEEISGVRLEEKVLLKRGQVYKTRGRFRMVNEPKEEGDNAPTEDLIANGGEGKFQSNNSLEEFVEDGTYTPYAPSLREAVIKAVDTILIKERMFSNAPLSRKVLSDNIADELGL